MNDLPVTRYIPKLYAKNSGIARGQTLQDTRRKCIAKSCFDVQKSDFWERSALFRGCFIEKDLGNVDTWKM